MSGLPTSRGTGRYSEDGRGYLLANCAAGAAIAGIPAPLAAGLAIRGLVWSGTPFPWAIATAVACGILLAVAGILAFLARRSADPITATRRHVAPVVITVTLAVGIPVGFIFAFYGDPPG
jgi:hypothetical protein